MRVGPRKDHFLAKVRKVAGIPHAAVHGEYVAQREALWKAALSLRKSHENAFPRFARCVVDGTGILSRPSVRPGIEGVGPGKNLLDRQRRQIGSVSDPSALSEDLRQRGASWKLTEPVR
jgi:hypothetical protein